MIRKLSRYAMRLMIGLIAIVVIIICIDHNLFDQDDTSINSRRSYPGLNIFHTSSGLKTGSSSNRNGEQQNQRSIHGAGKMGRVEGKEDRDKSYGTPEEIPGANYPGDPSHVNDMSYDRIHGDTSMNLQQASDDGNHGNVDGSDGGDPARADPHRSEFDKESMDGKDRGGSLGNAYDNDGHLGNETNGMDVSENGPEVHHDNQLSNVEDTGNNHVADGGEIDLDGSTGRGDDGSIYFADDLHHHDESVEHGPALDDPGEGGRPGDLDDGGGENIRDGRVVLGVNPIQGPQAGFGQPQVGQESPGSRRGKLGRKTKQLPEDYSSRWNISEEVRRLAPVVFKFVPPTFHRGYQGFCWTNMNGDLRCMPYFYLLGMPKCGTTDLWDRLVEHPHIIRVLKEPHWWTRGNRNMPRPYISRSISTVKKMIQEPASASKYILGDGSASYLWDMKRWQDVFDPEDPNKQLFLPHAIRAVTPKAKLIAAFREPVARLYSEYVYFSENPSPETFHDTVTSKIGQFDACTKAHSERKCVYQIALENGNIRLMIGIYSVFARDWLDVFPRDQMLFIRLEDWHQHCDESMPKIFKFLGVESLPEKRIKRICGIRTKNVNQKKAVVGPILEKTKVLLREFYRRWNRELAELLGDDRWMWNDVID